MNDFFNYKNLDNLYWGIIGSIITSTVTLLFSLISPFYLRNKLIMVFGFLSYFHKPALCIKGEWKARYNNKRFPNDSKKRAERLIQLKQVGNLVAGKSISENSNVKIEGRIVHDKYFYGSYQDKKDNTVFYGTFQVAYNHDNHKMIGKWIGFDNRGGDVIGYGDWIWEPFCEDYQ